MLSRSPAHIHITPRPIPILPKPDKHDPRPHHVDCPKVVAPSSPCTEPIALPQLDQRELDSSATSVFVVAEQQPNVTETFLGPDIYPSLQHQYPQYMYQAYWEVGYDLWTDTYLQNAGSWSMK
jgi:hypothetical protein